MLCFLIVPSLFPRAQIHPIRPSNPPFLPKSPIALLNTFQSPADLAFAFLQNSIRDFLRKRTSYDVLPLSFRLIVLDTDLLIKKSLNILIQNCKPLQKFPHHIIWPALMPRALPRARLGTGIGLAVGCHDADSSLAIVSAPLWDSHASRFAGILTATDYINVIQYHCQFPDEMNKLDQFRLSSLRGE
jgi:hypothetical protein